MFRVKKSISRKAITFEWPQKYRNTSGFAGTRWYWWLGLMGFRNFFIPYIFDVNESIISRFTKLPCSGDFENPRQLPVSHALEGTDDWILWIFVISSLPTFSRSRNPFFAVSRNYQFRVIIMCRFARRTKMVTLAMRTTTVLLIVQTSQIIRHVQFCQDTIYMRLIKMLLIS